jgi:hypothetical protein
MSGITPTSVTDVTEKFDGYFKALGRFAHQFAEMETVLQLALWIETAVPVAVARAIYSGVRMDQAKDFINRTRQAKGVPESERLARAFTQLGVIIKARNDILHYGARFDGTSFSVTNDLLAHVPSKARSTLVSVEILDDMLADLQVIKSAIFAEVLNGDARIPQDILEPMRQGADVPWRYKPTPPSPSETQPPTIHRG